MPVPRGRPDRGSQTRNSTRTLRKGEPNDKVEGFYLVTECPPRSFVVYNWAVLKLHLHPPGDVRPWQVVHTVTCVLQDLNRVHVPENSVNRSTTALRSSPKHSKSSFRVPEGTLDRNNKILLTFPCERSRFDYTWCDFYPFLGAT